ncbi:hypothetical protein GGF32_004352 [Allomyces javanicus]|nr:hypothetical protein GGF32_004352 [Allomyces javanicus]
MGDHDAPDASSPGAEMARPDQPWLVRWFARLVVNGIMRALGPLLFATSNGLELNRVASLRSAGAFMFTFAYWNNQDTDSWFYYIRAIIEAPLLAILFALLYLGLRYPLEFVARPLTKMAVATTDSIVFAGNAVASTLFRTHVGIAPVIPSSS